jgi:hypothetical protein
MIAGISRSISCVISVATLSVRIAAVSPGDYDLFALLLMSKRAKHGRRGQCYPQGAAATPEKHLFIYFFL